MDIYSPLNPSAFFMIQRRQRMLCKIFADAFPSGLKDTTLLEIGCGGAQWLAEFQTFGFLSANLSGIELDSVRAQDATARIPDADIKCGNAAELPWADNSFDIVFQSTVFTSIKDAGVRVKIASEMQRVCKANGFILWYDFAFDNPHNPDVSGVKAQQIRELFEPWNCSIKRVTLAPPIARKVAPVSWFAAETLETFCPFFRTHLIAKISK